MLITGAGGFLGSHLIDLSKNKFDSYGISKDSNINLPSERTSYFDLLDKGLLINKLNEIQPDYIIHCAAISSEGGCKKDVDYARKINVDIPVLLRDWCLDNSSRLIFTSTDLVFSGMNAPYNESGNVNPKLIYGQLKRDAEIALNGAEGVSIVRLPLLYGIGLSERKGLLNHFIEQCQKQNQQTLFIDEFRTPVFVDDIAEFLLHLVSTQHQGILHLGGKQRISRFDLGQLFSKHLNLSSKFLKSIKRSDIGMDDRPYDTTMVSNKAYELGFTPKFLKASLSQIYKQSF